MEKLPSPMLPSQPYTQLVRGSKSLEKKSVAQGTQIEFGALPQIDAATDSRNIQMGLSL